MNTSRIAQTSPAIDLNDVMATLQGYIRKNNCLGVKLLKHALKKRQQNVGHNESQLFSDQLEEMIVLAMSCGCSVNITRKLSKLWLNAQTKRDSTSSQQPRARTRKLAREFKPYVQILEKLRDCDAIVPYFKRVALYTCISRELHTGQTKLKQFLYVFSRIFATTLNAYKYSLFHGDFSVKGLVAYWQTMSICPVLHFDSIFRKNLKSEDYLAWTKEQTEMSSKNTRKKNSKTDTECFEIILKSNEPRSAQAQQETDDITTAIHVFMDNVCKHVSQSLGLEATQCRPQRVGSSAENTKCCQPDEFDFLLRFSDMLQQFDVKAYSNQFCFKARPHKVNQVLATLLTSSGNGEQQQYLRAEDFKVKLYDVIEKVMEGSIGTWWQPLIAYTESAEDKESQPTSSEARHTDWPESPQLQTRLESGNSDQPTSPTHLTDNWRKVTTLKRSKPSTFKQADNPVGPAAVEDVADITEAGSNDLELGNLNLRENLHPGKDQMLKRSKQKKSKPLESPEPRDDELPEVWDSRDDDRSPESPEQPMKQETAGNHHRKLTRGILEGCNERLTIEPTGFFARKSKFASAKLVWRGNVYLRMDISIDIVPAFDIGHKEFLPRHYLIAKSKRSLPIVVYGDRIHYDVDYAQVENEIIQNLPDNVRDGYKLSKTVRRAIILDNLDLLVDDYSEVIRTYYLKTALLFLTRKARDASDPTVTSQEWAIRIYRRLQEFIERDHRIPHFFQNTKNRMDEECLLWYNPTTEQASLTIIARLIEFLERAQVDACDHQVVVV